MDYRETPVTGPLAASVRCWWSLSSPAAPAGVAEPALPDAPAPAPYLRFH